MRNLTFLSLLLFTSTACNGNLLNGSAQSSPGQKPYKASDKNDTLSDLEMPDNLEEFLEVGLELIRGDIGDSEFTFEGLSFMNFESIMSDALDFVQEEGLDVEMTEEIPMFEDRSRDEIAEFISEFSLSYGEIDAEELSSSFELQDSLPERTVSAIERRWASMGDTAAARFALVEGGPGRIIPSATRTTSSRTSTTTSNIDQVEAKANVDDAEAFGPQPATPNFQIKVENFIREKPYYSSWSDVGEYN